MKEKSEYRRNAAEHLVAGGALAGAGEYTNRKAGAYLKNTGNEGIWQSLRSKKLGRAHAGYAAGKLGARSLTATGLPLAAAGAYQLVQPAPNRRVSIKGDIVRPVINNALYADQAKIGAKHIARSQEKVSKQNEEEIYRAKRRAKHLSRVSGALGLAALGARSPEIASAVVRNKRVVTKLPSVARNPKVQGLIAREPSATKLSNALGINAIGVGSAGSFNFARLQNLENKQHPIIKAIDPAELAKIDRLVRREAVLNRHRIIRNMTPAQRRALYRSRLNKLGDGSEVKKRDDKFLREHSNRISTNAEAGYRHLRRGYKNKVAESALHGALGAGLTGYALKDLSQGRRAIGSLTALAGASALKGSYDAGRSARAWNAKANAIKQRAYQRERDGEWGRDRQLTVAKGLMSVRIPKLSKPFPTGSLKRPGITPGHLMRTSRGKIVTVNGSVR